MTVTVLVEKGTITAVTSAVLVADGIAVPVGGTSVAVNVRLAVTVAV